MDNSVFRNRLYEVAERNGLTVSGLAKEMGLHENSLYRLKKQGDAWVSLPSVIRLASKYRIDANWLLGLDGRDGDPS